MRPDIDALLNKYWEGESSLAEEATLKIYFRSGDISLEHTPYLDLFGWMDDQAEVKMDASSDIDTLMDKYWEGETTLRDEEVIRAYFKSGRVAEHHQTYSPLFDYYNAQKHITYPDIAASKSDHRDETYPKVVKIYSIKKVLFAIAAVSILIFGAMQVIQLINDDHNQNQMAQTVEIEDPEEAMRVTKEALMLVSSKFRTSQQAVRENIKPLEKVAIFK